jgi:hypothetical protein
MWNEILWILIFVIIFVIMAQYNRTNFTGSYDQMKFRSTIDKQTEHDAKQTAKTHYGVNVRLHKYATYTPQEFDNLHVENHRAQLNATLEQMYELDNDQLSVKYAMAHIVSPVAVLNNGDSLAVLDGAHRIAAAYLTDTPIRAAIFVVK